MKKEQKSTILESSWVLEKRLKEIKCSNELKAEILAYIKKEHDKCTGKSRSITNIWYRCNLHYIEDNIQQETKLINELRKHNSML